MYKLKYLFICALLLVFMCACGKEEDIALSGVTYDIEVLYDDTHSLILSIPIECVLEKTDNHSYFQFSNGVSVYLMSSKSTSAKYDETFKLYIGRTFLQREMDNNCVVVNAKGSVKDVMCGYLSKAKIRDTTTDTFKEQRLLYLPAYSRKKMNLVGNMYMPDGCEKTTYDIFDAELYTDGTDWLQCWIADAKLDDIKMRLLSLSVLGTSQTAVDEWYQSDEVFYCKTGRNIVAAKRLAYNSWYVYYGCESMKDYIFTGIYDLHS